MADEQKFKIGDLVQVTHRDGKIACRVYGGRSSRYSNLYLVKPEASYVSLIEGTELEHYDIPEVTVDWGSVPAKPWLMLPAHMINDPFSPSMREHFKKFGLCPQCGDPGFWRNLACICPYHGPFLGV